MVIENEKFYFESRFVMNFDNTMVFIPIKDKIGISLITDGVETIFIIKNIIEVFSDINSLNNFIETIKSKEREIAKAMLEEFLE